jgi:hypothetical protein
MVDGEPVVRRLFADSVSYNPTRYTVHVGATTSVSR